MRSFANSLTVRLFLWLVGGIGVVFFLYASLSLTTVSNLGIQTAEQNANQTSELIKRATHYGMLLNRKDDVHQTIRRIAQQPSIAGIRIYDKQGAIMFSADPAEIGRSVDFSAEACLLCHDASGPVKANAGQGRVRMYREADGNRVLAMINPIENEPTCYNATCHAHSKTQTVLGVLDVKMSLKGMDESLSRTRTQILWSGILGVIILAGVSGLFILRLIRSPVTQLVAGARRVASGDLSTRLQVKGHDELADMATAFNEMTDKLQQARQEVTDWSQHLEQKVMEKTAELGRSQRQVTQMEKMASLGKLAASVAHELNNPLAGILTYSKLISRTLKDESLSSEEKADILKFLEHIQHESGRCGDIVRSLLLFSRQSEVNFVLNSLKAIIERSRMVVRHHMEMKNVHWDFPSFDGDDQVVCDANAIEQALVALFVNAVEAMSGGGTLSIRLQRVAEEMEVQIQDTGAGIAADDLSRIFEPFFTTKESASGVGLGLAVVYGIVQRHNGKIDVTSEPGKGTTFRILLPVKLTEERRKRG